MLELFQAGGWLMWPLLFCSLLAAGITLERLWTLRRKRIAPGGLVAQVWRWEKAGKLTQKREQKLRQSSPLGRLLAAVLESRHRRREVMKESIEDVGRQITHDLERFLNTLGTVAAVAPLIGLLGTVQGMIKVFAVIAVDGLGDPGVLAGGIMQALFTTAAGLSIAIPSLVAHRFFRGKVDELVVAMEKEALKLVEIMQDRREYRENARPADS